jgi:hypothetical protein
MVLAGCLLQDTANEADYIVEARVGTLGRDGHDINYGLPPSNALNAAASLVSGAPSLPALPELSLARTTSDLAAAKVAVFAYRRDDKKGVLQSGTSIAKSTAKGRWFLGAGPFQSGTIYQGTKLAGQTDKANELLSTDYAYRSAEVWDLELRGKVERPAELRGSPAPPRIGSREQPSAETPR